MPTFGCGRWGAIVLCVSALSMLLAWLEAGPLMPPPGWCAQWPLVPPSSPVLPLPMLLALLMRRWRGWLGAVVVGVFWSEPLPLVPMPVALAGGVPVLPSGAGLVVAPIGPGSCCGAWAPSVAPVLPDVAGSLPGAAPLPVPAAGVPSLTAEGLAGVGSVAVWAKAGSDSAKPSTAALVKRVIRIGWSPSGCDGTRGELPVGTGCCAGNGAGGGRLHATRGFVAGGGLRAASARSVRVINSAR